MLSDPLRETWCSHGRVAEAFSLLDSDTGVVVHLTPSYHNIFYSQLLGLPSGHFVTDFPAERMYEFPTST